MGERRHLGLDRGGESDRRGRDRCTPGARNPPRRGKRSTTSGVDFVNPQCGRVHRLWSLAAYGRHVSGAMDNRAAVFTSKPQAVEVYQAGAWWSGELLGWRHAADGSCQVWVRVVLGGARRRPGPISTPSASRSGTSRWRPSRPTPRSAEREQSVARHPSSRREHRADAEASATASMPMVRDLSVVSDATVAPAGGRRRAPEVPAAVSTGGRRRAPEETAASSPGGRRRAPEASPEVVAVSVPGGRRRAPEEPAAAPSGGRRRAPEDATSSASGPAALLGRHRRGRHLARSPTRSPHDRRPPSGRPAGLRRRPSARGRALPATSPTKPEGTVSGDAGGAGPCPAVWSRNCSRGPCA